MMTILLALMQISTLINGYPTTELTENTGTLSDHVIYEVRRNVTIREASLHVDSGKTGVIYIHEGCTLSVAASPQHAAIHVPAGAKLVIAGDANSYLEAKGGDPVYGDDGEGGGNASTTSVWKKTSYTGGGGHGGKGGHGAGAAIGGNGGKGGEGGKGGNRLETVPFATIPGNNGSAGLIGGDGEGMGAVFVSGQVSIQAIQGESTYRPIHQAPAGNKDESGYWVPFSYHKMNAGGGGGGGAGGGGARTTYGIGGGAPGGGGGGGGGSGAFDSYGGKETQGHGSSGQGGFGGQGAYLATGMQGEWPSAEPCRHDPSKYSGDGGVGGRMGQHGHNGQLYAQKADNFTSSTSCSWSQIQAANYPLDLVVKFDNVLEDLPKQPNQPFYYGMLPMMKITVPESTDPNQVFAGYYLPDSTLIYTSKGELTEAGKRLCYRWQDVTLTAYWTGRTHVHLILQYEHPNPSGEDDRWVYYPVDSFYKVLPEQPKHITWCAKDYLPAHYYTDMSRCLDIDLQPGGYYADTFVYQLNRHTIDWVIPTHKGGVYTRVYLKDKTGARVSTLTDTLPTGRLISRPRLYYETEDDSLGILNKGWRDKHELMPDSNITNNELTLEPVQVKVYVTKSDSGRLVVRNRLGEEVTQCNYGDTLSIQLVPNIGCRPNRPAVYTYTEGLLGDTLMVCRIDEEHYTFRCTHTVMLQCTYQPILYTTGVWYQYDSLPATGDKAHTWFVSKHTPVAVQTDSFAYPYQDQITFASWLDTDSLENWIVTPVVRTPVGDTLPVQWTLTDVMAGSNKRHVWMPAYTFFAPASNVTIEQTVYYRPRTSCTIFNHTRKTHIDSVFVNLNQVDLDKDSTTLVRTLDVVSIQVNEIDTHAVAARAGYWDEHNQYQRLPLQVDKVETEEGDFATVFSTMAPARAMVMGLIDGPRILLMHCDTAVEWIAPSAAAEGDTVLFRLEPRHDHDVVQADSVLIYDINSQLVYRFDSAEAWANQFVMLDTTLYVYVYAHVEGQYHSVTFLNANGDTLQYQDWYRMGDMPEYHGNTPELPSDTTKMRWVFQGWTPEIHPVAGNDVYTAVYKRHLYLHESKNNSQIVAECDGERVDVDFYRTLGNQYYYPIVFPFGLSQAEIIQVFGEDALVGEFSSTSQVKEKVYLNFALYSDSLMAGTPYLIKPSKSFTHTTLENKLIEYRLDTIRMEHAEYRPIIDPVWLPDRDYNCRFISNNILYWPKDASGPLRSFRAYFYMLDKETTPTDVYLAAEGANSMYTYIEGYGSADPYTGEDNTESVVTAIEQTKTAVLVHKILYHGQLYIIRNGVIYNSLGQRQ